MNNKYLRITFPKLRDSFRVCRKIFLTIFLFNIFFTLISNTPSDLTVKQKNDINNFLENLMIREGGLYTLLGSKPMTLFNVTDTLDTSEEGIVKSYVKRKALFEKAEKGSEHHHTNGAKLPDFDEYKKKCLSQIDSVAYCQKKDLWNSWQISQGNLANPIYKLFSRPLSKEKAHTKVGLFVNVPQALHILKKYRIEFCQITGTEFDADKILDSIEDANSLFWGKVLTNHYLLGLLLGYGEKNAYLFDWMRKNSLPIRSNSMLRFPELSSLDQYAKQSMKKNVTINDLPVPYFVTFEINDKDVEHYAQEREKIIDFLKDKDLVEFAINCLCQPKIR